MFKHILDSLKTNKFIITPNRRLASFLIKQLIAHAGENEVLDIKICSWQDALLQFRLDHPLSFQQGLLSAWQSRFLWQGVIRQSSQVEGVINLSDTQRLAVAALELCINWMIEPCTFYGVKEDSDCLIQWWESYQARCAVLNMIDEIMLPKVVLKAAERGDLVYEQILWYGFDEMTPLQQALISALQQHDCICTGGLTPQAYPPSAQRLIPPSAQLQPPNAKLFIADDAEQEWTTAILHAKSLLDKNPHPELPIGIVIPNIQQYWSEVSEILTRVFNPLHEMPGRPHEAMPYNISSGMALYDHPAIRCASEILKLQTSTQITSQQLTYLLGSPFITGGIEEQSTRAIFDLHTRSTQAMVHDLQDMLRHNSVPPLFRYCLSSTIEEGSGVAVFSTWVDRIMALLSGWGWPGDRCLDSITYQAVEQCYELLTQMRTLDLLADKVSFETVHYQWISQLKNTVFQPQTEDKPIQILGLLEAAGMNFSHLWVCTMTDNTFPAPPNPNPFIPAHIQRSLSMPHSSFDREWHFAQKMIERLSGSSEKLIFSYHRHSEEGYPVHPSYFVKSLTHYDKPDYDFESVEFIMQRTHTLEDMPQAEGLPLTSGNVSGGASLLQAQIACPFRAYALFRWKAQSPEPAVLGLSLISRGKLLHAIMHQLMLKIKDSQCLHALTNEQENELIQSCIDRELVSLTPLLNKPLIMIESQRLFQMIKASLNEERKRGEFRIKALELPLTVQLAGLSIRIRMDRYDETPDGAFLIDYKTGKVNTHAWDEASPDDPQLPLYAIALGQYPAGIAYAVLRKEEVAIKGQGIYPINGIEIFSEEAWQSKIEAWKIALTQAAHDFKSGKAQVAPKYGQYTCEHCDLALCCRVKEQGTFHE